MDLETIKERGLKNVFIVVEQHDNGMGVSYRRLWEELSYHETYDLAMLRVKTILARKDFEMEGPVDVFDFFEAKRLSFDISDEELESLKKQYKKQKEEWKQEREQRERARVEEIERAELQRLKTKYGE